jgi:hypothetical protein
MGVMTKGNKIGGGAESYIESPEKIQACMECVLPQCCERDSRCNLVTRGFIAGRTGGVGGRRKAGAGLQNPEQM